MVEIHANATYITRRDNTMLLTGQYGVASLSCTFDRAWDGLEKWAVFTVPGHEKPIKVKLVDNKCMIPVEALDNAGPVLIGAYGELRDAEGALLKRLSPAPIAVTVRIGSYSADAVESEAVTIDKWFAKQAATAQKAASAAIEAAKIANQIAENLKKQNTEEV